MCDVPSTAVFCSESIEFLPGIASILFLKLLVTIPVAPIITGIIVHFRFHIRCISIRNSCILTSFPLPYLLLLLLLLLLLYAGKPVLDRFSGQMKFPLDKHCPFPQEKLLISAHFKLNRTSYFLPLPHKMLLFIQGVRKVAVQLLLLLWLCSNARPSKTGSVCCCSTTVGTQVASRRPPLYCKQLLLVCGL